MNAETPGGFAAASPSARRFIDRRMRQLAVEPLDRSHGLVKIGLGVVAAFVLIVLVFGFVAPFSEAAVAPGEVVAEGDPLVVQPIESGIVSALLVHEGQAVRRGQPLVRLDTLRSGSALAQLQARHDALLAQEARLLAERDGGAAPQFPAALTDRAADPAVADLLRAERTQYARRQELLAADRALGRTQLVTASAQAVATRRQQALIGDELESYTELYDQGFARKTTVRSLQRSAAALQAERIGSQQAIAQARLGLARTLDSQAVEATAQLAATRQQLAQVGPQLAIARDVSDRSVLRAPADGRVSGVASVGPGTTVGGGKTLMTLVPHQASMVADVTVAPADVDDVHVGQQAMLRFATVNPHGRVAFPGTVTRLSPDRVGDDATSGFRARIRLDDPAAARREGLVLRPGIPVTANVKTRDRGLFDYLFSPLIDAMSRAFRSE